MQIKQMFFVNNNDTSNNSSSSHSIRVNFSSIVNTTCNSIILKLIFSSLSEKEISDILCDWILNFLDKFSRTSCLCCNLSIVRFNSFRRTFTFNFVLFHSCRRISKSILFDESLSLSRISINFWTIIYSCSMHLFVTFRRIDFCFSNWTTKVRSFFFSLRMICWLSRYLWRSIATYFDNSASATHLFNFWLKVLI